MKVHYPVNGKGNDKIKQLSSDDFNETVLQYIKKYQPDGNLNELIKKIKQLIVNLPVTSSEIDEALIYTDTILSKDKNYQYYIHHVLNKETMQFTEVNFLFNIMESQMMLSHDEENSDFSL